MENLKEFGFTDLSKEEMVQINGGLILWFFRILYKANIVRTAVNQLVDGWNSVDCACVNEKKMAN